MELKKLNEVRKMEEENLFFTEITETEKRIINLIRSFIAPTMSVESYLDFLVEDIVHKLTEKSLDTLAFVEVMNHERENSDLSNVQIMALINQYRTYLENDESTNKRVVGNVFADIIKKLEGDIVPIEVYSRKDNLEEEEKILDKIQQL
jgi:hypothetical protein